MPAGSTFDPFYQNLRTFFSQHTAQTGKQLGLNEMYGLTTGEMATQLAAKRIADQTALERERLALSAGQTAQQLRQQKILEERRLAEMEKTGASTREAQAWQNKATAQNIKNAPWQTAISGIGALGSLGMAGASWWDRLSRKPPAMPVEGEDYQFGAPSPGNTAYWNSPNASTGELNSFAMELPETYDLYGYGNQAMSFGNGGMDNVYSGGEGY